MSLLANRLFVVGFGPAKPLLRPRPQFAGICCEARLLAGPRRSQLDYARQVDPLALSGRRLPTATRKAAPPFRSQFGAEPF